MCRNIKFISRVEQDISLVPFALLTREISRSALKIFHIPTHYCINLSIYFFSGSTSIVTFIFLNVLL